MVLRTIQDLEQLNRVKAYSISNNISLPRFQNRLLVYKLSLKQQQQHEGLYVWLPSHPDA